MSLPDSLVMNFISHDSGGGSESEAAWQHYQRIAYKEYTMYIFAFCMYNNGRRRGLKPY